MDASHAGPYTSGITPMLRLYIPDRNSHEPDRHRRHRTTSPGPQPLERHRPGLIAVFAALVAGSALDRRPSRSGGLGVPITLQTLAVMLTGWCWAPAGLSPPSGFTCSSASPGCRSSAAAAAAGRPRRPLGGLHHCVPHCRGTRWAGSPPSCIRRTRRPGRRGSFRGRHGDQHHLHPRPRHPGNDGQRQAGLVQGVPRRPGLLPRRCDQERTGRRPLPWPCTRRSPICWSAGSGLRDSRTGPARLGAG